MKFVVVRTPHAYEYFGHKSRFCHRYVQVSLRDKELYQGPWAQANVEAGSSILIPVPSPVCWVRIC